MTRHYKLTIDIPEELRQHYNKKWENTEKRIGIKWSSYISDIIIKALEVIKDNEL